MEILKYCKLQIGLLLVLFFISYLFTTDEKKLDGKSQRKNCNPFFDKLFWLGVLCIFFDGVTAYTVHHLEQIPWIVNMLVHLAFLLFYQGYIFAHFMYWLSITDSMPKSKLTRALCIMPIIITASITIIFIPQMSYAIGDYYNYAIGVSPTASFVAIVGYSISTLVIFFSRKNYIHKNKRTAFVMSFTAVSVITLTQILNTQTLVASIAVVLVAISLYLCSENPTIKYLEYYHNEMVMGFATLVESKDGSTGGHIRRTSEYAVLIAKQLRKRNEYKNVITKDYLDNLSKAAPMHDVGKIGVPDVILQKPGKLTAEEFAVMKEHPVKGGEIIQKSFGKLDDEEYEEMAYNVAMFHHEKWNGNGYPANLSGSQIPLCARIMAVADVFDAVSMKRCYRDAMPLEQCLTIIREGSNKDFDPVIVEAFFAVQDDIERIYHSITEVNGN